MIEHILWDWNGTLLDDVSLCVDATNYLLDNYNLPLIDKHFYQDNFDFPVTEFYKKLGLDVKNNFDFCCTTWNEHYFKNFCVSLPIRQETFLVLKEFSKISIKQSIVSACEYNYLIRGLEKVEIKNYFEFIYGNKVFELNGKLEIAKKAFKKLNLAKEKVLIVGDTEHDYFIAKNLGIRCIILTTGHISLRRIAKLNVPQASNLQEVLEMVLST